MKKEKKELEQEFVPFEESSVLKELGFDEFCIAIHDYGYLIPRITTMAKPRFKNSKMNTGHISKTCTAPLYQQAFRWFRKKIQYMVLDRKIPTR